jgi:hypothetical protein
MVLTVGRFKKRGGEMKRLIQDLTIDDINEYCGHKGHKMTGLIQESFYGKLVAGKFQCSHRYGNGYCCDNCPILEGLKGMK